MATRRGTCHSQWELMVLFLCFAVPNSMSAVADPGPDVVVGDLRDVTDYNRTLSVVVLSMRTDSCNVGDAPLNWFQLPDNRHPVIAQNMYRLKDGRLDQIGQAWVKHGFAALQDSLCFADCRPEFYTRLGVHCSDPYTENLNRGPQLGSRREINPVTGYFDGSVANIHVGHVHTVISHGLQVQQADLGNRDARYFVEAQYIAADDALAGNGNNNVSHREVQVTGTSGDWTFIPPSGAMTRREEPAVLAWPDATFVTLDSWPEDGRIIVAYKVTKFSHSDYRYDYAVYNMNSERGIGSFSVPVSGAERISGFHAVRSHDEVFTNLTWTESELEGRLTWATNAYTPNLRANPIRWGTMYNFWFDTADPPVPAVATLGRYKPGAGPDFLQVRLLAPASGDCNRNGVDDLTDIGEGASPDDDADGIPDECIICTMSNGCGESDRCTRRSCDGGWCKEYDRLYGDTDGDGMRAHEDLDCVAAAFALPSDCPDPDLFPCDPDGDITVDDVLAALEAFDGNDFCCGH